MMVTWSLAGGTSLVLCTGIVAVFNYRHHSSTATSSYGTALVDAMSEVYVNTLKVRAQM